MIGYIVYLGCVWLLFRTVLAACRICSTGEPTRRRALTGKTALSTMRFRFYWILFLILSPILYFLHGEPMRMGWITPLLVFIVVMTTILSFLCLGMRPLGALVQSGEAETRYEAWLAAGGHPYWDANSWCNFDSAVVRAAIGRPPESDYCHNCGARITGLLRLGGNFGNYCDACGTYNDFFEEEPLD